MTAVIHDRRIDMLERTIAFDPDGEVPFDEDYQLAVPDDSGIYLFYDWRGPLYVGRAENIRRRFQNHFQTHNPHLARALRAPVGPVKFVWLRVPLVDLCEVEARLIEELCPICNIRMNDRPETRTRRR